jgi:hypothetical protein
MTTFDDDVLSLALDALNSSVKATFEKVEKALIGRTITLKVGHFSGRKAKIESLHWDVGKNSFILYVFVKIPTIRNDDFCTSHPDTRRGYRIEEISL